MTYFSAVLLYVCQPFLSLRSFMEVEYSKELIANLGIVFGFSLLVQGLLFLILWLIFYKKFDNPVTSEKFFLEGYLDGGKDGIEPEVSAQIAHTLRGRAYRMMVCVCTFGNVGFFGVPVLQFLFPNNPETIAYSAVYIVSMNLMCWTVGAYVLTGDKKYIKIKKALINPQTITLLVALPLFFAGVTTAKLSGNVWLTSINKIIDFLADMTAPMCMLILGMRFALAPLKEMFTDWKVYVSTLVKIVVFPLAVFLLLMPFDVAPTLRAALVLLSGMPCASMNLNLAELYGADQKTAANSILVSTLFCIVTIPAIMLLV